MLMKVNLILILCLKIWYSVILYDITKFVNTRCNIAIITNFFSMYPLIFSFLFVLYNEIGHLLINNLFVLISITVFIAFLF